MNAKYSDPVHFKFVSVRTSVTKLVRPRMIRKEKTWFSCCYPMNRTENIRYIGT